MINDTENAMDDKKTNIKFTDDAIELGDVDTFIAREWSEKYGEKITELAEAASGGANDFVSKINSMGMSLEQLLGQNLSELISSDLFSADLSARLSAASGAGANLLVLETNEIAFSAGSFNFSILGSNFSADLLQVVSLLNSGSSVEQALIDQISARYLQLFYPILRVV